MRTFSVATFVALLAACSPPAQQQLEPPSAPPAPQTIACNDVAPNASQQVAVTEESAAATAASNLRGGAIAPGVYDLIAAVRVGAATGWPRTIAVALAVAEDQNGGVTLNWAGAGPGAEIDRWTATLTSTSSPRLTYTCGRLGEAPAEFAAEGNVLQLRLQDGAGGQLALHFRRRS